MFSKLLFALSFSDLYIYVFSASRNAYEESIRCTFVRE